MGQYGVLIGKPESRRLLERPRRRWENNVKTYVTVVVRGA
jgi:hypothetical protein